MALHAMPLNAAIESLIPAMMKRLFFDDAISRSHAEQRKSPSDSLSITLTFGLGSSGEPVPDGSRVMTLRVLSTRTVRPDVLGLVYFSGSLGNPGGGPPGGG